MEYSNEELIEEWFGNHIISTLNIYVLALILVEQNVKESKNKKFPEALQFITDTLLKNKKIEKNHVDIFKDDIVEEEETLLIFKDLLFEIANNPNLLQKDKFVENKKEGVKFLLCKPASMTNFSFGHIKKT